MQSAPTPRHVLLVCHNAGGTIPPMIALAQEMVARGYRVTMLSQPSVRVRAEAVGCRFVPFDHLGDYEAHTAIEEQLDLALAATAGPEIGEQLLDLIRAEQIDAAVVDCNLAGAAAAAESIDIPSAVLFHCMYQSFTDVWFAEARPFLETPINATRRVFGLGAADTWTDVFAAHDLLLSVVPASFEAPLATVPDRLRHFGFLVPTPVATGESPSFPAGDAPTVLVSLSTTFQNQGNLLTAIIEALAGRPVRGLVTTVGQTAAGDRLAPANVTVHDYVEHGLVLDQTDVVITHAGLGTVAAGLSYGVPMVCLPHGRDQHLNARRVADCGAGLALEEGVSSAQIADALDRVLVEPQFRESARALAATSARAGGAAAAIDDLEARLRPAGG